MDIYTFLKRYLDNREFNVFNARLTSNPPLITIFFRVVPTFLCARIDYRDCVEKNEQMANLPAPCGVYTLFKYDSMHRPFIAGAYTPNI